MNEEESVKRIETMKYKAGDRVKIKSLDWYNKNKNKRGNISFPYEVEVVFTLDKSSYCGQVVTISKTGYTQGIGFYRIKEDYGIHMWTDEMIEGLVEPIDCKKCGLTRMSTKCLFMDNCPYNQPKNTIEIPKGWVLKDENGNVINATKIVLEKKKKEYPKSYEECCKVLDFCGEYFFTTYEEGTHLPENDNIASIHQILKSVSILTKLLICRNAYWKLYGEEMGLGKPWKPDWNTNELKYIIYYENDRLWFNDEISRNTILTFPTEEMRDAFYENFKSEIEQCKELL